MFNFKKKSREETVIVIDVACISKELSLEASLAQMEEKGILYIDTTNGGTPPYTLTRTKFK